MNWVNVKSKSITLLKWLGIGVIVVYSSWIWFPIVIWKTGLLISDHIMKGIIDD